MTDQVRRPRGHGDQLARELVATATELLVSPGAPPGLSLRAVARRVGVAPSAVYLHFPSQADLLAAVLEDRFADLGRALAEADHGSTAVERVTGMGRAYVVWGLAHPGAYRLLFERPDAGHDGTGPGVDLLERLVDLLGATRVRTDAERTAVRLWAALHGITSLRLHKPGESWPADVDADVAAVAAALMSMPA